MELIILLMMGNKQKITVEGANLCRPVWQYITLQPMHPTNQMKI
jgi:hypothetical protein